MAEALLGQGLGLIAQPDNYLPTLMARDRMDQAKQARKQAQQEQENKILNESIKIDWDKYHRTDIESAKQAYSKFIDQAMKERAQNPLTFKNNLSKYIVETQASLNELLESSDRKRKYEEAYRQGKVVPTDEDKLYMEYLTSGDNSMIPRLRGGDFSSVRQIDPRTGAAIYEEVPNINPAKVVAEQVFKDSYTLSPSDKTQKIGGTDFVQFNPKFDEDRVTQRKLALLSNPEFVSRVKAENANEIKSFIFEQTGIDLNKNPELSADPNVGNAVYAWYDQYIEKFRPVDGKFTPLSKGSNFNINVGGGDQNIPYFNAEEVEFSRGQYDTNVRFLDSSGKEIQLPSNIAEQYSVQEGTFDIPGVGKVKVEKTEGGEEFTKGLAIAIPKEAEVSIALPRGTRNLNGGKLLDPTASQVASVKIDQIAKIPVYTKKGASQFKNVRDVGEGGLADGTLVTQANVDAGLIEYVPVAIARQVTKVGSKEFENTEPIYVPLNAVKGRILSSFPNKAAAQSISLEMNKIEDYGLKPSGKTSNNSSNTQENNVDLTKKISKAQYDKLSIREKNIYNKNFGSQFTN